MYGNSETNTIKDLTLWLDALDHECEPLAALIEAQIQRIERGGPGAKYAQRDLEAITQAINAHRKCISDLIDRINDLGDAYLAERAKARAYEKRSEKLWNTAFKGAMTLAQHMGRELDTKLSLKQNQTACHTISQLHLTGASGH